MSSRAVLPLVYAAFVISGATGLVYEVVWARVLTQIFGNTTHAISTVLSAFMAGLALGSWGFGRIEGRLGRGKELQAYAALEAGIGLYGVVAAGVFGAIRGLYASVHGLAEAAPALYHALLFGLAFGAILVPTALMGATLPVLSRFAVTSLGVVGKRIGLLYGLNTLGAVLGCALAGFWLLETLGLSDSTRVTAVVNLAIAGFAYVLSRRAPAAPETSPEAPVKGEVLDPRIVRAVLVAFGVSGASAMVLENAWTRALTLVIGMSTYSFTIMLTTFLVGLALGSLAFSRLWGERPVRPATLGVLELAIGLASLATIALFERLPFLFLRLQTAFSTSFGQILAIQVALSALVLIVPTLLFGATFPIVARLATGALEAVGRSVGTAYACNTVGSILGAFAGGFVFIPLLGLERTIALAALLTSGVGIALVFLDGRRGLLVGGMVALAALAFFAFGSWDRTVLTSGVVAHAPHYLPLPTDRLRLERMRQYELLSYADGLTCTISVDRSPTGEVVLRMNGKADASSRRDAPTQLLVGWVPLLARPDAKRVLVIGLGSGMTASAVAHFPVERIDCCEIEEEVTLAAKRFFAEANGGIVDDPRLKVSVADGRNFLLGSRERWDVIVSQPSNPWIAGIANLFTQEYYAEARSRLAPGGIFAQWMQTYSMAPEDLRMVCRTFAEAFPEATLWSLPSGGDLLFLGSEGPQRLGVEDLRRALEVAPRAREGLARLGLVEPESLYALWLMPRARIRDMTQGARINSDDVPVLEFSAPRNLHRRTDGLNAALLAGHAQPARFAGLDPRNEPRQLVALARGFRTCKKTGDALAASEAAVRLLPDDPAARVVHALALADSGRTAEALEEGRRAGGDVLELARVLPAAEKLSLLHGVEGLEARLLRGEALAAIGSLAAAEAEVAPLDSGAELVKARAAAARGDAAAALELAERASARDPTGQAHALRGELLFQLGRPRDAVAAFRAALRLDMGPQLWRINLGVSLAHAGDLDEAELVFRDVLALYPDNAQAWEMLNKLGREY